MKLVLVGGFLGSGKTTAITKACHQLIDLQKKVAVVTNDQGDQQVDHSFVQSMGIETKAVSNGCFCCHFDQLENHLLNWVKSNHPDFVFAESVGSCTDLIATIVKPLHTARPDIQTIVTIFADVHYLISILEGTASFLEESVRYIYKKQLEEADLLILNKTDLITSVQLQRVRDAIHSEYPGKRLLTLSGFVSGDITKWIEAVTNFDTNIDRDSLDVDYSIYGSGESKLAWLDKTLNIYTHHNNAVFIGQSIIASVFDHIQIYHITIGHLKFFIETNEWKEKVSFTSTSTSGAIKISRAESSSIKMLINARVQTEPEKLRLIVDDVLAACEHAYGCTIESERWAVFRPGYPKPLHRIP
jgi:G3E family GTPase